MAAKENTGARRGNPWLTAAWVTITAILLLTPLAAMQFTEEVNWTVGDFVFAGVMLVGSGIIYELAARAGNLAYQAAVVVALGAFVLTMWATGAVGIIGSEANPGNVLYVGVLGLGVIGAIFTQGRARGLAWVTLVLAAAQMAIPVVAYAGVAQPREDVLAPEVFGSAVFFAALWALSAWLFRRSTRKEIQ